MKKVLLLLCVSLLLNYTLKAQAPQGFNYQAVARNTTGIAITNQNIGLEISLRQGSATGTIVYTETFNTTSNNIGLINVVVGTGTVTAGTFNTINWASGVYFIEISMDATGGTSYALMGTQQLMSVPYALYALSSGGTVGATGATGTAGINGTNGTNGINGTNGLNGTNGTNGLVGATGATGTNGTNGAVGATGAAGTNGTNGAVGATGATGGYPVHTIGESYGGGIVFYVYDGGQHGLIAATADQSTSIRWYGGTNTNTRARGDGIGAGLKNTAIIIANQGSVDGADFAATVCNEYSVTVDGTTYGDWYLPSKHELNLLYLQETVVGGFASYAYWSSTEDGFFDAWYQNFSGGLQSSLSKNLTFYVRAVRAF